MRRATHAVDSKAVVRIEVAAAARSRACFVAPWVLLLAG
jgi:hypothetical protein